MFNCDSVSLRTKVVQKDKINLEQYTRSVVITETFSVNGFAANDDRDGSKRERANFQEGSDGREIKSTVTSK